MTTEEKAMPMDITLRKIEPKDNLGLKEIIQAIFEEYKAPKQGTVYSDPVLNALSDSFHAEKCVLYVAEYKGTLVGCCGIYPTEGLPEGYAELVKFYIAQQARGIGIGKLLMQKSFEFAHNSGYKKVYIESLPEFSKAVQIYEKQGFQHLTKPLGNSGHTTCNIWLVKEL